MYIKPFNNILTYLFWLIIFFTVSLETKAEEVVLTDNYKSEYLGKKIVLLEDITKNLTIDDIVSDSYKNKFEIPDKDIPSFGFSQSAYWLKLELRNNSNIEKWIIEFDFKRLNQVELYVPTHNNKFTVKKSGILLHHNTQEIKNRSIVFQISPKESEKFYIRVESPRSAMQLPIIIWKPSEFYEKNHREEIFFSLLYGIFITLIIYNFIVFCILKDNSYFYYCLICFSILVFQMSTSGYGYYYIWPDYIKLNLYLPWIFIGTFYISSATFMISFFELKKQSFLYKILSAAIVFSLISTIINIISFNPFFSMFSQIVSIILLISPIYLYFSDKSNVYIRLISFSWFITVFSILIGILNRLGFIPKSFFIDNIFLIVLCAQSLLISLALGAKFKFYRDQKNDYYEQLEAVNFELSDYRNHLEDLVKEKTKELQEAKNGAENIAELKSNFLSTMSHEIRTPMNTVIGMSELLSITNLDKDQKSFVETIKSSGEILLGIINNILDFSKIDSKNLELESNEIIIRDCIEEVIDIFYFQVNEKEIDLLYLIDSDVPEIIISDVTRLKQIIINLISNALKFTSEGEVLLTLKLKSTDKDNCELLFAIKDTGIGIPDNKKTKIFKSFSQADTSTSRKFGGTGLGLIISKQICNLMEGDIWFENNPDRGTTFTFNIKVPFIRSENKITNILKGKKVAIMSNESTSETIKAYCEQLGGETNFIQSYSQAYGYDLCIVNKSFSDEEILETFNIPVIIFSFSKQNKILNNNHFFIPKPIKNSALIETINLALFKQNNQKELVSPSFDNTLASKIPLNILIAEDNPMNQRLASKVFENLGYKVEIVSNGLEAISAYEKSKHDLIFMDIQMPEMDGIQATEELKKIYGKDLPKVIAFTANIMPEDKVKYMESGMIDCISKPFKIKDIEEIIKKFT